MASAESVNRVRAHLLAQLVCLGRHTLTGLLATNGQLQNDWSADYRLYSRQRIDPGELFSQVRRGVQLSLGAQEALTVAMDDSILRKSGRKTPGVGYRRDPLSPPLSRELCARDALCAALGTEQAARWILSHDSHRFSTSALTSAALTPGFG
jgi:hypothetical protein